MTTEQKQEERKVDMMLPTSLLSQLNELFKDSKTDIHKVYFTVFWINKGVYRSLKKMNMPYQEVSSQYGNWISDTTIIPTLEKGGIIKKEKGSKRYYQRFVLLNKFNYKGKSAKGSEYDLITLYDEDGAYVKKYIDGKHNVIIPPRKKKNETKIKHIKTVGKENTDNKLMELQDLYNELQASFNIVQQENFELKAENKKLKEQAQTFTEETQHVEFPTKNLEDTPFFKDETENEVEIIEANPIIKLVPQQQKSDYELLVERTLIYFKVQQGYWRKVKNYILNADNAEFEILCELLPISGANVKKFMEKIKKVA